MTKGWTEERREKARQRILQNKPWEQSTGPKTVAGKQASSLNAMKHGIRSRRLLDYMTRILNLNKMTREQFVMIEKLDQSNFFKTNELIKKINENKDKTNETQT